MQAVYVCLISQKKRKRKKSPHRTKQGNFLYPHHALIAVPRHKLQSAHPKRELGSKIAISIPFESGYWKGAEVGVCALWSVTATSQKRRETSMRLLEEASLATGKELPINAPQLTTNKTSECSMDKGLVKRGITICKGCTSFVMFNAWRKPRKSNSANHGCNGAL